jgi:F0F1-type ATP synthase membrane subunit c/vacuolar-type H+-ATPase subunit K
MRRILEIGGFFAAVVLIAFGIGAIVMSVNGRNTVQDTLAQEHIVGTPDMTPAAIKAEAKQAGLDVSNLSFPTKSVANLPIDTGERAHAFAGYMRIHALEATSGKTYAEMPRYATPDGEGTNDPAKAVKINGQPQDNAARNVWINETALSTALQSSYMAEQLSLFGLVVGIALLLSGIGFGVLAAGGALRNRENALGFVHRHAEAPTGGTAVPVA